MLKLVDFNDCKKVRGYYYGGDAGAKYAILYNDEVWMVKYPKTTRNMIKPQISYTTSPLSEYIGSKIFETFNIPVHETLLGVRNGKVVVACKDFLAGSSSQLIHFHDFKNSFMSSDFEAYSGTGSETLLSEALDTLRGEDDLKKMPEAIERFWDMFVIDAFIGDNDRHNNNWGFLFEALGNLVLAPVYDNGNAFYNKRSLEQMQKRLNNPATLNEDTIVSVQPALKYTGLDNEGHKINPFDFMKNGTNDDCTSAVTRFKAKVDMESINSIIDEIPESYDIMAVMPQTQKDFYKALLQARLDFILQL